MIRVQRVGSTVEVEADSGTAAYSVVHFAFDEWAEFVHGIEAAATSRAERAEAEVEMQRAILRRVRDLQARAEGYDFTIDPADLLAALRGTDNTGGTDGS